MGASFPVQKPVNDRFLEDTTLFFKEVNALITFYVFSKLALLKVYVTVNLAQRNSNLEYIWDPPKVNITVEEAQPEVD